MKTMKSLKIGNTDYDEMKARALAIARGELQPAEGEPTVWFTSPESVAKALSTHRELLGAGPGGPPGGASNWSGHRSGMQ
ncbi:MAG: hypothetical protein OXI49_13840 [Acidobacteriota bacterium]|nr:hypothetical protein [Acidobacteriota bacterium]